MEENKEWDRNKKDLAEKYTVRYKYATDNPKAIKPGVKVKVGPSAERFIVEVSDKTLRLEGDTEWKNISEVRFAK